MFGLDNLFIDTHDPEEIMGSNIRISNSDLDPIPCPLGGPTYVFFTKDGDIRYGTCFLAHSISSYPRAKALEAAGCPAPGQGTAQGVGAIACVGGDAADVGVRVLEV